MNTVCIIQARMGSTRLPGKALLPLGGVPCLERVINRCRLSGVPHIVVATSTEPEDKAIEDLCASLGVCCHRGSPDNVLSRFLDVSQQRRADKLVRVCGDNPLVLPESITGALSMLEHADYASFILPDGKWIADAGCGLYCEAFTRSALDVAVEHGSDDDKEHVTPYMRNPESGLSVASLEVADVCAKFTLDTEGDLEFLDRICGGLECDAGAEKIRESLRWTTPD